MEEKLFLVCASCGEAFDELTFAKAHENNCEEFPTLGIFVYEVLPESEAF